MELRSTEDFQIIRELNIIYNIFIHFSYGSGWLVTNDKKEIKFLDSETLACCRTSNSQMEPEPLQIFINSGHALIFFGSLFTVHYLPTKESSNYQLFFAAIPLTRGRLYSHFILDELQIVSLDRTQRYKLVCLDFMKHRLRGPVI
jgi:hypothetical protein